MGTATLQKEKLDVLHSTSAINRIPMGYQGKTVVTFHDMAAFEIPQFLPAISRTRKKAISNLMAAKAVKIIAVSNSVKAELKKHLKIVEEKMQVV